MTINPSGNHPYEGHAKINLDKLLNDPSIDPQSMTGYANFIMTLSLIKVYDIISSARNLCNLAAIKAGFNSADETAKAGTILGVGGLVLGATGVAQGAGKFEEAAGIAEATEIRNHDLKMLDAESKAKDLNKDIIVKVEAVDKPCTSGVNDDIVSEIEEDALSAKQNKMQSKAEDIKQENISATKRVYGDVKKNKRIKLVNKNYEVNADKVKADTGKLQSLGTPGQAAYYVAQGLSEHQKAKSQKESLVQQIQQDNQNQLGNTADGVKKEIDKLSDFDPFKRNSSSLR